MEMWNKISHDFGKVQSGSIQTTKFVYNGSKEVREIEPLCNCLNCKFEDNELKVIWKTKANIVTEFQSNKIIAVIYDDQTIDDLTLTACLCPI
jgi:hypothetical protein